MSDSVAAAEAAIHLGDVSKVFGKVGTDAAYRAVDGLDLDVRPGQMLALLGKTDEAVQFLNKSLKDHPDSTYLQKMADPRGLPRTFQSEDFKSLMAF